MQTFPTVGELTGVVPGAQLDVACCWLISSPFDIHDCPDKRKESPSTDLSRAVSTRNISLSRLTYLIGTRIEPEDAVESVVYKLKSSI